MTTGCPGELSPSHGAGSVVGETFQHDTLLLEDVRVISLHVPRRPPPAGQGSLRLRQVRSGHGAEQTAVACHRSGQRPDVDKPVGDVDDLGVGLGDGLGPR